MSDVITGLFESPTQARIAVEEVERLGVSQNDISVVANGTYNKDDFAVEESNKAAEGAIVGAATTGVIAALAASLTAVGTVATGGAGLLVAGPVVAALAAGGAGAAAGATVGAIVGAFIPEHEIKFYEDAIEKGSVLIGVKYNSDNKSEIKEAFEHAGADKVSTA